MTTSYLFAYYTLDSQVSLSSNTSIKTGLFSFWLSVVSLLQFLVVCIITVLWKNLKKSGKNKKKLRTISPKNHENFKNSKSRVVLLVLIKKSVPQQEEGNHYSLIKGVLYRSDDTNCFFIFRVRVLLFTK